MSTGLQTCVSNGLLASNKESKPQVGIHPCWLSPPPSVDSASAHNHRGSAHLYSATEQIEDRGTWSPRAESLPEAAPKPLLCCATRSPPSVQGPNSLACHPRTFGCGPSLTACSPSWFRHTEYTYHGPDTGFCLLCFCVRGILILTHGHVHCPDSHLQHITTLLLSTLNSAPGSKAVFVSLSLQP